MAEHESRIPPQKHLRLRFAGREACPPGHAYGMPRDHFLLHLVESGQGTLELAGKTLYVRAPSAFLVPPFEGHRYRADSRKPWTYAWLGVDGPGAPGIFAECGFSLSTPVLATPRPIQARQAFASMVALFKQGAPASHTEALGHFYLFCARFEALWKPEPHPGQAVVDARVTAACEFIATHYPRPLTTAVVAEHVGLERSYFSKIFSEQTGMGIHRFLLEHRMRVAEQFLEKGGYSLREVAKAVGYDDYATFERAFRRLSDITPRAFAGKFKVERTERRISKAD